MNKIQAKQRFNCDDSQPVLAVLGGSQGSVPLNRHFQQQCKKYTDYGIQILWQCGKKDYELLQKSVNEESGNFSKKEVISSVPSKKSSSSQIVSSFDSGG